MRTLLDASRTIGHDGGEHGGGGAVTEVVAARRATGPTLPLAFAPALGTRHPEVEVDVEVVRTWDRVALDPQVTATIAAASVLRHVVAVPTCGSTQDVALEQASDGGPSGTVVVAGVQTAGRGRTGREWADDAAGGSLAISVMIELPDRGAELVPHALGLAVLDAGRAVGVEALRLKWPNDVVVRTEGGLRKVCGVLVERTRVGAGDVLVAGIGVNVDHRHLPDMADRTSLAALSGARPDRVELLCALLRGIDTALAEASGPPRVLLSRYREVSDTIGRPISVQRPGADELVGIAETVDDEGRLVVRDAVGRHVVISGTVRDAVTA
jgi:BirA family transcriptional regulator, biotin operon repressor / biotin---[acetyl-CoA-carboxylase] ligase